MVANKKKIEIRKGKKSVKKIKECSTRSVFIIVRKIKTKNQEEWREKIKSREN